MCIYVVFDSGFLFHVTLTHIKYLRHAHTTDKLLQRISYRLYICEVSLIPETRKSEKKKRFFLFSFLGIPFPVDTYKDKILPQRISESHQDVLMNGPLFLFKSHI